MLKIIFISTLFSFSCLAGATENIYKITYTDRISEFNKSEFYSSVDEVSGRIAALKYNSDDFEHIKITTIKLGGGDAGGGSPLSKRGQEQIALVKRGGEGGGD
jgi:hypothetical protein